MHLPFHRRGHTLREGVSTSWHIAFQHDTEDQVPVVTFWVLVDGARVHLLLTTAIVLLGLGACSWAGHWSSGDGEDVDNREGIEELLWLRFLKTLLALVPASTFKVKTVDKDTFSWHLELLAFNTTIITLDNILGNFGLVLDLIEGPLLGLSLAGDLLLHGGKETLWVEETCQPE